MAGKRDEVFILGEEQVGSEPGSAPPEEPSASAPEPGRSRSSRPRWLILGALALVGAIVLIARLGGEGDPPPRAATPAPEVAPITRVPRQPERLQRPPERQPRRPRSGERPRPAKDPQEPPPLAEAASAPTSTYAPAPEIAPEPAPEGMAAAPAPAAPLPSVRPEFGIER